VGNEVEQKRLNPSFVEQQQSSTGAASELLEYRRGMKICPHVNKAFSLFILKRGRDGRFLNFKES
jgi:hypothetical protein